MALYAMNDYVGDLENIRALNATGVPDQYPLGISGLGADVNFGPLFPKSFEAVIAPPIYVQKDPSYRAPIVSSIQQQQNGAQTPFGEKVNTVTDAITRLAAAFAPAFQKAPKQKVVIQKEPDYTTYAVIGGAVIVASVLAIAVGKSGRRRNEK